MKPIASADVYDLPGTDYALVDMQHIKGAHNRWLVLPVRQWAVAAYMEIGRQTGRGPEAAYREVAGEVHALGGFMPDGEPWMAP